MIALSGLGRSLVARLARAEVRWCVVEDFNQQDGERAVQRPTRRAVDPVRRRPEGFALQWRNPQLRSAGRPKLATDWLQPEGTQWRNPQLRKAPKAKLATDWGDPD